MTRRVEPPRETGFHSCGEFYSVATLMVLMEPLQQRILLGRDADRR